MLGLLGSQRDKIRWVTYQQAEDDVKQLAARLLAAFTYQELSSFNYTAVPRGGFIVLGMLAYVLNLPPHTFFPKQTDAPYVVVDDCAISGGRFASFLRTINHSSVIFAHLYSHPHLRQAIVEQEPRVSACFAAQDLEDSAPDKFPVEADYQAWQQRWQERLPGRRYWIGLPDFVIFPWNEPDRPFWNPATEQVENNWRLAAPDRCLKNWARLGLPPIAGRQAHYRIPDSVAHNLTEQGVILCDLGNEQVYGLEGVSADMWRALAAYGDPEPAVHFLLGRYDIDESTIRRDLAAFIEHLVTAGLLEPIQ